MVNASGDNELFVSITADYSGLEEGMDASIEAVAEGTQTMQAAIEQSAAAIATSNAAIGESADQASARIKAMVAASLEQQAANSGTAESETSLAERLGLRVEATAEQIAATQASIAAQDAQMESVDAYVGTEAEATTAVEANTVATAENTEAMVINGGVARELGVLMGELARGNYTRMEGSTITLANRTGLLTSVFSPLGLAIGAAAAAVAGFTYEVVKGEQESEAFNKALINTGGSLGITEGQFNEMALSIRSSETTIGAAREAMIDFAQSGKIGGDMLETAGKAAVDFSALTGKSMQESVAAIVKLQEDPVKAITALNEQYHFLSLAELDHVQQLQNEGDATAAASEAITLFQQNMTQRLEKADQDVGILIGSWRTLKSTISDYGDELASIGRKSTIEDQINNALSKIDQLKAATEGDPVGQMFGMDGDTAEESTQKNADEIASWEKVIATLKQAQKTEADTAAAIKQRQDVQDAGAQGAKENDTLLKGIKGANEYTQALNNELAALKAIHEANADDSRLQGISFDKDGNASGGEGLARIETYLHKKYDLKAAAHQNERKLDQEELLQEEADEGISYDQRLKFELGFWQKKMDAAKKGSTEYAQAYRQVQTLQEQLDRQSAQEADAAAKAELAAKLADIDSEKALYDDDAEASRARYEQEYDDGQITMAQLAVAEKDLVAKKLAADVGYLNDKMALDKAAGASGVKAAEQEAQQIHAVQEKAANDLRKINDKAAKDQEHVYQQAGQQISRTFGQAISSMLFEGQTLKQGMANVAESMAEQFIEAAIEKPLEAWIAKEAGMLAATIGTLTGQATATDTQRATDAAADSLATTASIAKAAGVAGAQGTASFAAAPWPVDIGAPAFGAAMALEAMSYATVASASGGWEDVPADQLAMIHKNEMVLPAHVADSVRQSAASQQSAGRRGRSGGAAGALHVHIHAMDAKSFKQALRGGLGTELASYAKGKGSNSAATRSRG